MRQQIKLHLQKYIFYDIFVFILFICISYFVYVIYDNYQINKNSNCDFSNYNSTLMKAYNINPSLFNFDENGIAIVEMSALLKPITNGKDTMYWGEVPLTKDQDQCVGYIIVKKTTEKFNFDYSHLCDMVDY